MEEFSIDLKTFLGLAKPNQYSQSVRKLISSWFWGDKPSWSLYIVLPYYMIYPFQPCRVGVADSAVQGDCYAGLQLVDSQHDW